MARFRVPKVFSNLQGGTAGQAGVVVSAADLPLSFQRSLMPRSTGDQAIVTGLSVALNHSIASLIQEAIEFAAERTAGASTESASGLAGLTAPRATIAADALAIGLGLAIQTAFQRHDDEHLLRAGARTSGYWLAAAAAAGGAVTTAQEVLRALDPTERADDAAPRLFPVGLPLALVAGGVSEFMRRRAEARDDSGALDPERAGVDGAGEVAAASAGRALMMGLGVSLLTTAASSGERALGGLLADRLSAVLPGHPRFWRLVSRVAVLTATGFVLRQVVRGGYHQVEVSARQLEPGFDVAPESANVSGGPGSFVAFGTLDRQGSRFVRTAVSPADIATVMGEPAKAEPIRVFVGLQAAGHEEERVELAMHELRRTDAFSRSLLLLVSPTGTGYVNYAAVEAAEFMTRGDIASAAIQYSERPSPMSLDRVWEGRRHFRMLVSAVADELERRPEHDRPRVVVFGESLGALTSQDGFLHRGTLGLLERGVDAALWIGTPYFSGWKREVLGRTRSDVDSGYVAVFNDFGQVESLSKADREKLRYVMITHDDDAVAKFGLDLLVQSPEWLGPAEERPPCVPRSARYSSPTTFLLTLIDMKNAAHVVPGVFAAKGHDYRADLAPFVREVYRLDATDAQVRDIAAACARYETARAELVDREKETREEPDGHDHEDRPADAHDEPGAGDNDDRATESVG